MNIALLIGAGVLAWFFFRNFETVNGLRHFTSHGRENALKALQGVSLNISTHIVDGAASFETDVGGQGLDGITALQTAESNGGIVVMSETFLDNPDGAVFAVMAPGNEQVAADGSGLAILSVTPP